MLEKGYDFQPRLLKVSTFVTEERNITQPQEREALNDFRSLLYSKQQGTLRDFRDLADDHGLALIEKERNPKQQADLDSYLLVKKVTDDDQDISPTELEANLAKYKIATITFQREDSQ